MSDGTNNLLREIIEEPVALKRVYDVYLQDSSLSLGKAVELITKSRNIYFTGMATSEYAAIPSSILLNQNGKFNFIFDTSELIYYQLPILLQPKTCLVLVSQSGDSAEITHIINVIGGKVPIIGVFNNEDSYLASHCDIQLPIFAGPQLACGSKTNLNTMALLLILANAVLRNDPRKIGRQLLETIQAMDREIDHWEETSLTCAQFLANSPYTAFLGRGQGRASALFSSILFREVAKMVTEGMGAAQFRHGLVEMIRPEHKVVIFAPGESTNHLLYKFASEMIDLGVSVLLVTNQEIDLGNQQKSLVIKTDFVAENFSPLIDIVPLQFTAYQLAKLHGYEPGVLNICKNVTTVE